MKKNERSEDYMKSDIDGIFDIPIDATCLKNLKPQKLYAQYKTQADGSAKFLGMNLCEQGGDGECEECKEQACIKLAKKINKKHKGPFSSD